MAVQEQGIVFDSIKIGLASPETVSYTHLDVYKRQGVDCGTIEVLKGGAEFVQVKAASDVSALIKKGQGQDITEQKQVYESLEAPFDAGCKAGEIVYYFSDGSEAGKTDIITAQGVEKATIEQNINNVIKKWIY